jgi:hypothetical protein
MTVELFIVALCILVAGAVFFVDWRWRWQTFSNIGNDFNWANNVLAAHWAWTPGGFRGQKSGALGRGLDRTSGWVSVAGVATTGDCFAQLFGVRTDRCEGLARIAANTHRDVPRSLNQNTQLLAMLRLSEVLIAEQGRLHRQEGNV